MAYKLDNTLAADVGSSRQVIINIQFVCNGDTDMFLGSKF